MHEVGWSYIYIISAKSLVVVTLKLNTVVIGFLEISYHFISLTITVMDHNKVGIFSRSWYINLSIYQRKMGCVIRISYAPPGLMDQWSS